MKYAYDRFCIWKIIEASNHYCVWLLCTIFGRESWVHLDFLMLLRWSFKPPDMGQNVSEMGGWNLPGVTTLVVHKSPRSTCDFGVGRIEIWRKNHHWMLNGCWFTKILGRNATPKDSGVMKWAMGFHKESLELFEEAIAWEFWAPEIIEVKEGNGRKEQLDEQHQIYFVFLLSFNIRTPTFVGVHHPDMTDS